MCVSFAVAAAIEDLWGPHNAIAAQRITDIVSTVPPCDGGDQGHGDTELTSKKSQLINESEDMSWMPRR